MAMTVRLDVFKQRRWHQDSDFIEWVFSVRAEDLSGDTYDELIAFIAVSGRRYNKRSERLRVLDREFTLAYQAWTHARGLRAVARV